MNTKTKNTLNDEPSVYVGTYAKYNNGSIAGAWISLDGHDEDSFLEACRELHADEADPEFMFQDFENFPREFYGESGLSEGLWEWLELSEDDREMLARYSDATGDSDATFNQAQDAFQGTADSEADFAENLAHEMGWGKSVPSWLVIDWDATWNCNLRFDYSTSRDDSGTIWFFHNH